MATHTTVTLEDDLDGGPADETLQFRLGPAEYEIDLSAANADRFRTQMAPFITHARKQSRAGGLRPGRSAAIRQHSADIRAWAKDHGIGVSERGRLPADIVEKYRASHD